MKILRKNLKYIFPFLLVITIGGLFLSRVYQPVPGIPEPEITISSEEAIQHIGKAAEVCGTVANTRFIPEIGGKPTFINFGKPSPNQEITVVIWGENRPKWDQMPEIMYSNKRICATGVLEMHKGTPQIEVIEPNQLHIIRD